MIYPDISLSEEVSYGQKFCNCFSRCKENHKTEESRYHGKQNTINVTVLEN